MKNDIIDPGVRTGVTGIIIRDGKVLLGLRGDACETAKNEWAFAGGRQDYSEDPITSIRREIIEETTLKIPKKNIEFLTWVNEFFPEEEKHYVSLVFFAKSYIGYPKEVEPTKCKEWKFFDPNDLPKNTFWSARQSIEEYRDKIKNS